MNKVAHIRAVLVDDDGDGPVSIRGRIVYGMYHLVQPGAVLYTEEEKRKVSIYPSSSVLSYLFIYMKLLKERHTNPDECNNRKSAVSMTLSGGMVPVGKLVLTY